LLKVRNRRQKGGRVLCLRLAEQILASPLFDNLPGLQNNRAFAHHPHNIQVMAHEHEGKPCLSPQTVEQMQNDCLHADD
jgi:hypothetical protein